MAPIAEAHCPAQFTTYSHSMSPWSVSTPDTRPSAVEIPVTLVRSRTFAPRLRAPLASADVRSVGLALPSPGSQIAPSRSSTRITG